MNMIKEGKLVSTYTNMAEPRFAYNDDDEKRYTPYLIPITILELSLSSKHDIIYISYWILLRNDNLPQKTGQYEWKSITELKQKTLWSIIFVMQVFK
jgi:hypothetical protein